MFWKAIPIAAGLAGSALALSTVLPAADHETLPPAPSEIHAQLATGTPLEQAVALAAQSTSGKSYGARLASDGTWVIDCVTATTHFEVVVGNDGAIQGKREVPRFPGEPATGEMMKLEGGLQYIVIRAGEGAKPSGPTSEVEVHYTGYLTDGTKFDSSVDRGAPSTFPLNRVIKGWTVGVGDMQVGEKRKLIIPYEMAYGAGGRPGSIPPKATLIFDVELISIKS